MIIFDEAASVELAPWPELAELSFVRVLDGSPVHKGVHLFGDFNSPLQAGVWECSEGKFKYTYPGNEICVIVEGMVDIIDMSGHVTALKAGSVFFTIKGESVVWDIKKKIRKIFMVS
ncbi:cupin domain-containing protein [Stutzerimonas stutzeri]|uniref:cupin domain-containing protein n=1 Tax=Stutzerimonas stutzeri TaxID=316 RepID=UPI0037CFE10E